MRTRKKLPIPLIHFFGPDGAGKSTQVEILVRFLEKKGFKVKKCWIRSPHTLAFLMWRVFIKIGFYRIVLNPFGVAIKFPAVHRSRVLRFFWSLVEFISVLPPILRVYISIFQGYKLVAERYVLDTVTTVAYFIHDIRFLTSFFSKALLRLIPRETKFIFLDSDFETILNRRKHLFGRRNRDIRKTYGSIPSAAVEPRDFIEFQRVAYKALVRGLDALTIDTSKFSIEQTSHLILRHLRLHH